MNNAVPKPLSTLCIGPIRWTILWRKGPRKCSKKTKIRFVNDMSDAHVIYVYCVNVSGFLVALHRSKNCWCALFGAFHHAFGGFTKIRHPLYLEKLIGLACANLLMHSTIQQWKLGILLVGTLSLALNDEMNEDKKKQSKYIQRTIVVNHVTNSARISIAINFRYSSTLSPSLGRSRCLVCSHKIRWIISYGDETVCKSMVWLAVWRHKQMHWIIHCHRLNAMDGKTMTEAQVATAAPRPTTTVDESRQNEFQGTRQKKIKQNDFQHTWYNAHCKRKWLLSPSTYKRHVMFHQSDSSDVGIRAYTSNINPLEMAPFLP